MTNEFKKITNRNETRYVIESMTAGATGVGAIATAPGRLGKLQKRLQELKDKVPQKPRQGPLRPQTGAGAHKNKKKDQQRGIEKHKGQSVYQEEFNGEYDDEAGMAESNLHTLARAVKGLMDTIDHNDNLPEWCQEKIAKAEMMLVSVWDYLLSQKEQGIDPEQGVTEADKNFVSFMNKSLGKTVDKPSYQQNKDEIMGLENMPGFRKALNFGLGIIKQMDDETKQHFAQAKDNEFFNYLVKVAKKKGLIFGPNDNADEDDKNDPRFFEEDLEEVTTVFDEVFHDPEMIGWSWADLLRDQIGQPVQALGKASALAYIEKQRQADLRKAKGPAPISVENLRVIKLSPIEGRPPEVQIWYDKGGEQDWAEIAGGYPSESEANAALARMKKDPKIIDLINSRIKDKSGNDAPTYESISEGLDQSPENEMLQGRIGSVLIKLYDKGYTEEKIRMMQDRIAKHLGYELNDKMFQSAFDAALTSPEQGVAEDLDEAVGGNYLYHATGSDINDLKNIISNGLITNTSNQERTGSKLRALSFTRSWRYALTNKDDDNQETTGIANGVIFVVDKSILIQKNKMQPVDRPADAQNALKSILNTLIKANRANDLYSLADSIRVTTSDQLAALSKIAGVNVLGSRNFIGAVTKPYFADKTNQQALADAQSKIKQAISYFVKTSAGKSIASTGGNTGSEYEEVILTPLNYVPFKNLGVVGYMINPGVDSAKQQEIRNLFAKVGVKEVPIPNSTSPGKGVAEGINVKQGKVYNKKNRLMGTWDGRKFTMDPDVEAFLNYEAGPEVVAHTKNMYQSELSKQGVVEESDSDLSSSTKRDLIANFKQAWQGGSVSVEQAIEDAIRPLLNVGVLKRSEIDAAEEFLDYVADMEQQPEEPYHDRDEDPMLGIYEGKIKGADGKACWKGKRYAGTKNGKDICIPVGETDQYMTNLSEKLNSVISEKAPPGDKYERMVKHIKKGYAKDGKLTDVEKRKAYGAAWKAKNQKKK